MKDNASLQICGKRLVWHHRLLLQPPLPLLLPLPLRLLRLVRFLRLLFVWVLKLLLLLLLLLLRRFQVIPRMLCLLKLTGVLFFALSTQSIWVLLKSDASRFGMVGIHWREVCVHCL